MYHHHSQQEEPPQPFSDRPGPFNHQEQAHQQQQQQHSHFQSPPIKGSRDTDMESMNMNVGMDLERIKGSGFGSFSSFPQPLPESQPGHQRVVLERVVLDWSNYQPPGQTFSSPPSTETQQPQSSNSAMDMQAWMHEPPSPQTRGSHSGGVDVQGVSESARSILARFGLSSQDLEALSQYPDDQLTPDKLPHILQDMLSRKSNDQKISASSSSSYSQNATHATHDTLPPASFSRGSSGQRRSPEVSSLCIDYGHSSLTNMVSSSTDTFIREPLSPCPPQEIDVRPERWQISPPPAVSNMHVDLDYQRSSGEFHKSKWSPTSECPLPPRSRHPDLDYRWDDPKRSPTSETWSDYSSSSRLPAPWSSLSKPLNGTKICDYSAESPKQDWIDDVESYRDQHNKYPEWKPIEPRREQHFLGQDDIPTTRERSPSDSDSLSARRERLERDIERLKQEDHGRGSSSTRRGPERRRRSPGHHRGSSSSSTRHGPERRTSNSTGHHRGSSTSHGPEKKRSQSPGHHKGSSSTSHGLKRKNSSSTGHHRGSSTSRGPEKKRSQSPGHHKGSSSTSHVPEKKKQ